MNLKSNNFVFFTHLSQLIPIAGDQVTLQSSLNAQSAQNSCETSTKSGNAGKHADYNNNVVVIRVSIRIGEEASCKLGWVTCSPSNEAIKVSACTI